MSFDFLVSLAAEEKDTFQIVVGWLGNMLALFFFFSPAVGMYKLIKEKIQHTTIPYALFIASITNCLLWFVFGWKKEDDQVYICNAIGGTTSLIYLLIFWFYFLDRKVAQYMGMCFATVAIVAGVWATFQYAVEDVEITGYVAMVFNVIMYAAPGQKLARIF